jgi:hypothetical protein
MESPPLSPSREAELRIATVDDAAARAVWLEVPYKVFEGDPAWVAPLRLVEAKRFTPKHPFFAFGEAQLFIAYRGEEPVGRISAHVNKRHLEWHKDDTGHFGFFECMDDPEAAQALVDAAADWLRAKGLKRMVGPLNFSTNEESGLLVEGFDTQPAIMMTHARPWFGPLLEGAGLSKEMDLYAYRLDLRAVPEQVGRLAAKAYESGRIRVRNVDTKRLQQEMELLTDIFNDAWSQNWGFVPFHRIEVDAMVSELKPFFRANYGRFAEIDGRPAAVMIGLPDINGLIQPFRGKLLPLNWLKLVMGLQREEFRGARIPLLGIRREYQHTPLASSVLAALVKEFVGEAQTKSLEWVEFSWVLETNKAMNALGRLASGAPVKTFRIYSKALSAAV